MLYLPLSKLLTTSAELGLVQFLCPDTSRCRRKACLEKCKEKWNHCQYGCVGLHGWSGCKSLWQRFDPKDAWGKIRFSIAKQHMDMTQNYFQLRGWKLVRRLKKCLGGLFSLFPAPRNRWMLWWWIKKTLGTLSLHQLPNAWKRSSHPKNDRSFMMVALGKA